MKVLFDHPNPFLLAHGGLQTQIEQTKSALEELGLHVEWLRWWDGSQSGDLIHYFGRPDRGYIDFARVKGMRVVISELLTGLGSRTGTSHFVQKWAIAFLKRFSFFGRMSWDSYGAADAIVMLTTWEAHLMVRVFGVSRDRVHVVPNGVEKAFLSPHVPASRQNHWLICTATITPRKRVLDLAQAAVKAGTPLWVLGKPYAIQDSYFAAFKRLVENNPQILRYEGEVSDRASLAGIYREARGFALLSTMESLSLSALEAAACGCPLLLSDLPWARTTFGASARYCDANGGSDETARHLRAFYDGAPSLPTPARPATWLEVAEQLQHVYEQVLSTSR